MNQRRLAACASLLLCVSALLVTNAMAANAGDNCPTPDAALSVSEVPDGTDVVDCGLSGAVLESDDGTVGAVIPAAGYSVGAYADGVDSGASVIISVDDSGEIVVEQSQHEEIATPESTSSSAAEPSSGSESSVAAASAPAGAISACSDGYYKLTGDQWANDDPVVRYHVNTGSIPSYMYVSNTKTALAQAVTSMVETRSPCVANSGGVGGNSPSGAEMLADTTRGAAIGDNAVCLGRDGWNVITFGTLPSGKNAVACWYTTSAGTTEVDMKFNKSSNHGPWDATIENDGCQNGETDLRSVATHEAGHWMGLSDIYDTSHFNLTMYGITNPCEARQYTLALGDYRGIKWIYNPSI